MSLRTIFTALADQVRRLSGRTGFLGVEAMTDALSGVTLGVNASGLTAGATDVILDKEFIGASGERQLGTMTNNGAVDVTLDASTKTYNVQAGYHNGNGKVQVVTQTKSVTPGASSKTVYPDSGKLLSAVTVGAVIGKSAYTGYIHLSANEMESLSIPVGVPTSANDNFYMFATDVYEGFSGNGGILSFSKEKGQFPVAIYAVGSRVDHDTVMDSFSDEQVGVTMSGYNVVIELPNSGNYSQCFSQHVYYRWVLVKG